MPPGYWAACVRKLVVADARLANEAQPARPGLRPDPGPGRRRRRRCHDQPERPINGIDSARLAEARRKGSPLGLPGVPADRAWSDARCATHVSASADGAARTVIGATTRARV